MADPVLDKERFLRRLKKLYDSWNSPDENASLAAVQSMFIAYGTAEDGMTYSRTQAMHVSPARFAVTIVQLWLFGYELPDMILLFTKTKLLVLASKKKTDFMSPVVGEQADGLPTIETLIRDKNDKDAANFSIMIKTIKAAGVEIGEIAKEKIDSEFTKAWRKQLTALTQTLADISTGISLLLAGKEQMECDLTRQSCNITCAVWNKCVRKKLLEMVENESKLRHEALADLAEKAFSDRKVVGGVDLTHVETAYSPIVQSGSTISMKLSAQSKQLEDVYQALLDAQQAVIDTLRPGNTYAQAYAAGLAVFEERQPTLVDKLTKSFGFVTGIMFRDNALLISAKCTEKIVEHTTIVVHMGVADVPNPTAKDKLDKTVGLLVSDTYLVTRDSCECLTEVARRKVKSMAIKFEEDDTTAAAESTAGGSKSKNGEDSNKENIDLNKQSNEEKRRDHQKDLADRLNSRAQERLSNSAPAAKEARAKKSNISYRSSANLPKEDEVRTLRIYVDRDAETVIVPIFGMSVPIHISMVKNVSTSLEGDGDFTYLRVNLAHPGSSIGSKEAQSFPDPRATFVKELTYRASNLKESGELHAPSSNLNTAFRLIKEMQKRYRTREAEEREKEGIIKQDKLTLSTNKANPRLKELFLRPNVVTKRVSGTLEAHLNGFRYTSLRGDKVDVMFNNIKHAFFQPCDSEMIVLLHFHLKQPVLFGKKKQLDVQFYTEVGEVTTDLGKYHHMQDRDDAEREMRHKLNLAFKSFCEKVERQCNGQIEFDVPFRELGFIGVPHRSSVRLQPTSGCLVSLVEWPPFVITLEELELVHFERVSFQLKNFDAVFIFKDYTRKSEMVQQIPMESLDSIKDWLNSCDIHYTEGIQSLNWPKIMKTIVDDTAAFFADGGWSFLEPDASGDDEEEKESDDDDDVYRPSDEDDEEEGDSDASDESGSGSAATSEEDESGSGDEDEDADSSGKDWSDLEEEAKRADRERGEYSDSDNRKAAHGKRKAGGSGSHRSPAKQSGSGRKPSAAQPPAKRRK